MEIPRLILDQVPPLRKNLGLLQQPQKVQSEMLEVFLNLQQTVVRQHMMLKLLLIQQEKNKIVKEKEAALLGLRRDFGNHQIRPLQYSFSKCSSQREPLFREDFYQREMESMKLLKEKSMETMDIMAKRDLSIETQASNQSVFSKNSRNMSSLIDKEKSSSEGENEWIHTTSIIRRNGFKNEGKVMEIKQNENCFSQQRKSNKLIIPKRPPSKAKHLWINYGRKIIEFGINNTKDSLQDRIKQLVGKLNSKKDFEDVFRIKQEDSESEKAFKTIFGKLALFFTKTQTNIAFEGSKYREQMIKQKNIVASWIAKLINEDLEE